jgi:hypothetical protein
MGAIEKASAYIISEGSANHQLELGLAGIDPGRGKAELVAAITGRQNDDGSFPAAGPDGGPGSVLSTSDRVDLLARVGEAGAAGKGAAWLAAQQREDGGFCENPALADTIDGEWDWYTTKNTVTWMTGDAIVALALAGGFDRQMNAARNLLLRTRNKDGGWPGQVAEGYPDRTDLWTVPGVVQGLLAAGIAPNHDVFAGLPGALGRQKDGWKNPIENPLPVFLGLGRRAADDDVQACLKLLAAAQNDDGGWPHFVGGESHPAPTTAVLALLAKYRLALPDE